MQLDPNTFILFKKKITSKDGKELTLWAGEIEYEGIQFEISGFRGTSKDGKTEYLKGKCKEPWVKPSQGTDTSVLESKKDADLGSIPF